MMSFTVPLQVYTDTTSTNLNAYAIVAYTIFHVLLNMKPVSQISLINDGYTLLVCPLVMTMSWDMAPQQMPWFHSEIISFIHWSLLEIALASYVWTTPCWQKLLFMR